jgi:hypothetical protein
MSRHNRTSREMAVATTVALAALSPGCASLPDVTLRYKLPTWSAQVTVTMTLVCTAAPDRRVVVLPRAALSTSLAADADPDRVQEARLSRLDSAWANTSFALTLADDGRLLGVNSDSTGQGETVVKALLSLTSALRLLDTKSLADGKDQASACAALVAQAGGEAKPLALVSTAIITRDSARLNFKPDAFSAPLFARFADSLPKLAGTWELGPAQPERARPAAHGYGEGDVVLLKLAVPQPLSAKVKISNIEGGDIDITLAATVPSKEIFTLPILPPRAFGKQSFALELHESGSVKKLTYAKDAGTAAALSAASEAASKLGAAGETARLKAEADLLAAEQRLLVCRTSPKDCK